ncbi:MAG TPA: tetratricopeptide repeat protein [Burkholderiaceae bacterium]|nr:tetratricopeptide repeat protein [Burkholderiaceae bacterium]
MPAPTSRALRALTAAAWLACAGSAAWAVDSAPPAKADTLAGARTLIQQKKWSAAVDELKRVNDTGNADWNNLMGYSLRKGAAPDYAGAEKFYNEALRIDPKHRGALEYSGELYLMTGELPKAEQRLDALDKACRLPCEEYTDLKKAVARFKANGNKYAAEP